MSRRSCLAIISIAIASASSMSLVGCATYSEERQVVEDKERGDPPKDPMAGIKAHLHKTLKDPFSAQVEGVTKPTEGWATSTIILKQSTMVSPKAVIQETRRHGWVVDAKVNAKNGYGAYVGWHDYRFVFRGEEVIWGGDLTADKEERDRRFREFMAR